MKILIFIGIMVASIGISAGYFLSILTTSVIFFIGSIFIVYWIWDVRKGDRNKMGDIGVFFTIMLPITIFVITTTITGLIFHWDDLLYMLRGLGR